MVVSDGTSCPRRTSARYRDWMGAIQSNYRGCAATAGTFYRYQYEHANLGDSTGDAARLVGRLPDSRHFSDLAHPAHHFGFILIDGLYSYKAERFAYDFARQNDATIVVDDVNELHPDSYRLSTRIWVGRQIARWRFLFEVMGRVFNDGGTARLYRELGFPEVHHGPWIVLGGSR